uniref:Uncharacterized protein n=1 Tax=Rhizophora mucronata TaxID=61149 RepID=A0A2P2JN24_RHIMU
MQRLCSKLRSLAALSTQPLHTLHSSRRLLHCSPQLLLRYQPPHSIFLGERWSLCSQLFSPSSSFACRSSLRPLPVSFLGFFLFQLSLYGVTLFLVCFIYCCLRKEISQRSNEGFVFSYHCQL